MFVLDETWTQCYILGQYCHNYISDRNLYASVHVHEEVHESDLYNMYKVYFKRGFFPKTKWKNLLFVLTVSSIDNRPYRLDVVCSWRWSTSGATNLVIGYCGVSGSSHFSFRDVFEWWIIYVTQHISAPSLFIVLCLLLMSFLARLHFLCSSIACIFALSKSMTCPWTRFPEFSIVFFPHKFRHKFAATPSIIPKIRYVMLKLIATHYLIWYQWLEEIHS